MTSEQELLELIAFARSRGAVIDVTSDMHALVNEGRCLIETVRVSGVAGIGKFAMSPLHAAEVLREYAASIVPCG